MLPYIAYLRSQRAVPAIVAHRGDWAAAPENSVAAIEAAISNGYEIAELDVRKASDGSYWVFHDDHGRRMWGDSRVIEEMDAAEIASLRLFNRAGHGETAPTAQGLPTLDAALEAARGRIYLDLDVKIPGLVEEITAEAARREAQAFVDVKLALRTKAEAERLRRIHDTHGVLAMPMSRVTAEDWREKVALIVSTGSAMVETGFDRLDTLRNAAAALADAGVSVWVNTLGGLNGPPLNDAAALADPDAVWGVLVDHGVSVIQTDAPAALKRWRTARGAAT